MINKGLISFLGFLALVISGVSNAAIDVTGAITEVSANMASMELVGGALLLLAASVAGYRFVRKMMGG